MEPSTTMARAYYSLSRWALPIFIYIAAAGSQKRKTGGLSNTSEKRVSRNSPRTKSYIPTMSEEGKTRRGNREIHHEETLINSIFVKAVSR
jgi:hypothetical protein